MKAKFVNEILKPDVNLFQKFKEIFLEVKDLNTNDPFYELNERLNPLYIYLIDYDNFIKSLHKDEKQKFMLNARYIIQDLSIKLCAFNEGQIQIIVDNTFDDNFLQLDKEELNDLLNQLWSAFGHENIHMQQVDRMKTKQYPEFKSEKEYFKNKQEIMALAFSFVEETKELYTKEQIINMLKRTKSNIYHPLLQIYKNLDKDSYKLFIKYVYKYLTDQVNESLTDLFKQKNIKDIANDLIPYLKNKIENNSSLYEVNMYLDDNDKNIIRINLNDSNDENINSITYFFDLEFDFKIDFKNNILKYNVTVENQETEFLYTNSNEIFNKLSIYDLHLTILMIINKEKADSSNDFENFINEKNNLNSIDMNESFKTYYDKRFKRLEDKRQKLKDKRIFITKEEAINQKPEKFNDDMWMKAINTFNDNEILELKDVIKMYNALLKSKLQIYGKYGKR